MVLEIRLKNFFSLFNKVILDFRAANINSKKAKVLQSNLIETRRNKVLKSIGIYGANASGKSNIIKAIRTSHFIILRSHLFNQDEVLPYFPFKFGGEGKPSEYFIRFILNGIEYEYSFAYDKDRIVRESLFFYPKGRLKKIFVRDETIGKEKKEIYSFGDVIRRPMDVAQNTSSKTLFLSRASQLDRDIPKQIFNYFAEQFVLNYQNNVPIRLLFEKYKDILLKALQIADSDIIDIRLEQIKQMVKDVNINVSTQEVSFNQREQEYLKVITFHKYNPEIPFDFALEESDGTQRLFYTMLTIIDVIKNGKFLLVDEISEKLHQKIVEFIIDLFHKSNSAQLLFTTHNIKLLNLNKFRKDQIYFTNKTQQGETELYSLYDFSDFRDTMDVQKAYLQGRFDAIPYLDSVEKLKELING